MKKGLIIFAREPVPGEVKTRLAASIGNQAAAELYSAMLQDVLQAVSALHDITPIIFWANKTIPQQTVRFNRYFQSRLQSGNDLGERMAHAFDTAFSNGFESCCIIGSDSPGIPPEFITKAFELLENENNDVTFGPAADGGYYLIGMRQTHVPLFNDIPWSSLHTLEKSCEKADLSGIRYVLLPEWYDIDTLEDLAFAYRKGLSTVSETHKVIERLLPIIPAVKEFFTYETGSYYCSSATGNCSPRTNDQQYTP